MNVRCGAVDLTVNRAIECLRAGVELSVIRPMRTQEPLTSLNSASAEPSACANLNNHQRSIEDKPSPNDQNKAISTFSLSILFVQVQSSAYTIKTKSYKVDNVVGMNLSPVEPSAEM